MSARRTVSASIVLLAALLAVPTAMAGPQASFTVNPAVGSVNTNFQFDASSSTNTAGSPGGLTYSWSWDGDNTYEVTGDPSPVILHQFSEPGLYTVKLKVEEVGTGDIATDSQQVLVTQANYAPAGGVIRITDNNDGLGPQYSISMTPGWLCTTALPSTTPRVTCTAPPPPPGYDGWACNAIGIWASTWGLASEVNGKYGCTDTANTVAQVQTGDLMGPNGWGWASFSGMLDVVEIECRADGVNGGLMPTPPYAIGCGDP